MAAFRLIAILLLFAGVSVLLTWGLHAIKIRWIKYLPGGLALAGGIYQVAIAQLGHGEGFQDIARILMAILLFASAAGGLITALLLDLRVFSGRRA